MLLSAIILAIVLIFYLTTEYNAYNKFKRDLHRAEQRLSKSRLTKSKYTIHGKEIKFEDEEAYAEFVKLKDLWTIRIYNDIVIFLMGFAMIYGLAYASQAL